MKFADLRNGLIVWLQGGLGNQLFQVDAGYRCASAHGLNDRYSRRSYERDLLRSVGVTEMLGPEKFLTTTEERLVGHPYSRTGQLKRRVGALRLATNTELRSARPGQVLIGYFQGRSDLPDSDSKLTVELRSIRDKWLSEGRIATIQSPVAIHVRRGDYATNRSALSTFGILTRQYYVDALDVLGYTLADATIFTDDPAGVIEEFGVEKGQIANSGPGTSDLEVLLTMATSRALVIANSTFSWWAAQAAGTELVAAPMAWFLDREDSMGPRRPEWHAVPNI